MRHTLWLYDGPHGGVPVPLGPAHGHCATAPVPTALSQTLVAATTISCQDSTTDASLLSRLPPGTRCNLFAATREMPLEMEVRAHLRRCKPPRRLPTFLGPAEPCLRLAGLCLPAAPAHRLHHTSLLAAPLTSQAGPPWGSPPVPLSAG